MTEIIVIGLKTPLVFYKAGKLLDNAVSCNDHNL
jgi:hypothetical protein